MKSDEVTLGTRVPPPQFLDAAQRIAHSLSLDLHKVIAGYPMTYQGVDFWLRHYGQADPDGMVLMIEIGRLSPSTEAQVLRALMEYQYVAPAGIAGYCAVMPDSDLLAYCMRIDFQRTPNPAGEVLDLVGKMTEIREDFSSLLAAQEAGRQAAGTAEREQAEDIDALAH